jgi:hypothetical protein
MNYKHTTTKISQFLLYSKTQFLTSKKNVLSQEALHIQVIYIGLPCRQINYNMSIIIYYDHHTETLFAERFQMTQVTAM